jgi:short-subunit dehydrogenase
MAAAADETERVFGKVHVLVNNAGVGIQGPFKGITYADWDFGMAVNLGGVINGLQTFLPRIRAHGEGGHIVSTASLAALVPMPAQFVTYVAAKAAVVTISETIRGELRQENIGVSVLCPGPIRTNIHEVAKNRPVQFQVGDAFRANEASGATKVPFPSMMEPSQVGELVLNAIRKDELYIITHGEWRPMAEIRYAAIIKAMPEKLDPALVAMLAARPPAPGQKT